MRARIVRCSIATLTFAAFLLSPSAAAAHCDGLDGPVVKAAVHALDTKDISHALIWIAPGDERELRDAFQRTLAVRALGAPARELADRFFFETLVRLHRTSEGAPYTGLKPAGRDLGPAIPAADRALDSGSPEGLLEVLSKTTRDAVLERFHEVYTRRRFQPKDVAAGRAYVKAYVEYVHLAEALYLAATVAPKGHAPEPAEGGR